MFRGASIISVGSVDFAPYIKLLLSKVGEHRLADLLIVITDGDPPVPKKPSKAASSSTSNDIAESDTSDDDSGPSYNRALTLEALGRQLDADDVLHVAEAPHTLEADLLVEGSDNHEVLGKAYVAQHPKSAHRWTEIVMSADPRQEERRVGKEGVSTCRSRW